MWWIPTEWMMLSTKVQLTPKQVEYVREAHHRWNFAVGAVRSGKSHLAVQYTIPISLMERKGKKGINVILGATEGTIRRNVIEPMQAIWGDALVGNISSDTTAKIFGEKVYCLGCETKKAANRLRGSEVKFAYVDEITDINQEAFEMLKSRLSLPYSACHAAANPQSPQHFVKQFLDKAADGVDIYCQKYTIYDNPFLPPEYVKSLEAEYAGTVYYQRYILGEWVKAEGLVYPMYQDAFGKPNETDPITDIAFSLDYGTLNAFACILWERQGNVWYGTKAYYYSGRTAGKLKTDTEYLQAIERYFADAIEPHRESPEKIETIVDPSAASFIALLQKSGWSKVRRGENNIPDGIRETATAMQTGKIKLNPEVKEFEAELGGYVWNEKLDGEELPVKQDDHLCDAIRYFVKTKGIARPKTQYKPLWGM